MTTVNGDSMRPAMKYSIALIIALAIIYAAVALSHGLGGAQTPTSTAHATTVQSTTTILVSRDFFYNLTGMASRSSISGATYRVISANPSANETINVTFERYGNASRLNFRFPSAIDTFIKDGSSYIACYGNATYAKCFSLPVTYADQGAAASIIDNDINITRGLSFYEAPPANETYNGAACTLMSATWNASGASGKISACISMSDYKVYNFTISSGSAALPSFYGNLIALDEPTSYAQVIALPNGTLSQMPGATASDYYSEVYMLSQPVNAALLCSTPRSNS